MTMPMKRTKSNMPQPDEDIMDIHIEEAPEPEGIDAAKNEMVG